MAPALCSGGGCYIFGYNSPVFLEGGGHLGYRLLLLAKRILTIVYYRRSDAAFRCGRRCLSFVCRPPQGERDSYAPVRGVFKMRRVNMTARELKDFYCGKEFREAFGYEGELGAILSERGTEVRLWSPLAKKVSLHFYESGDGESFLRTEEMKKGEYGVWSFETEECLNGLYYDFTLLHEDGEVRTADPYAKAAGVNGKRSMILRLSDTDPAGWAEDRAPAREAEDIIYELHVKEFSHDPSGGFHEENRGLYKAFTEKETSLFEEGKIPTGLRHIKELGANYIQILPAFDYSSVDETKREGEFNWGYDPLNYNVPEGSYASDPYHGEVRIKEFKEMVMSLHKAGFRVIMDVVYNHTVDLDSWLQKTVPWYYYRVDEKGRPSDGSACGNDVASEMPMAARYILESVLYWAKEYHIDGFRFDLMGLLDVDLMNRIKEALDEAFGKDEKLIFGEPWAAGATFVEGGKALAVKKNLPMLSDGIGIFSDDIRDSIKGSVFYEEKKGFANGELSFTENIKRAMTAWRGNFGETIKNPTTDGKEESLQAKPHSPAQIVNYVSCHDNQTLWDKLSATGECEKRRKKEYRLAAAMYQMAQGRVFLYSGEEFLRTKGGEHNSYKSPISVNQMDWTLVEKNRDMVSYYKGLLKLRKEFTGLSDKSPEAYKNIEWLREEEGFLAFRVINKERDGLSPRYKEAVILFNGNEEEKSFVLSAGTYKVLSDGEKSDFTKEEEREVTGEVRVAGISAMILGKV